MSRRPTPPTSRPFGPGAAAAFDQYSDEFENAILLRANEIARSKQRLTLAESDIELAQKYAYSRQKEGFPWREAVLIVGTLLLGTGVQNGFGQADSGMYGLWFYLYAVLALLGIIVIILAFAYL